MDTETALAAMAELDKAEQALLHMRLRAHDRPSEAFEHNRQQLEMARRHLHAARALR